MSSKRSRIVRSSSLGEIFVFKQPIEPPVWNKRKSTVQKSLNITKPPQSVVKLPPDHQPQPNILTIGSPEREITHDRAESKDNKRVGGFFEKCYSCKKKIGEKDDVFMYSFLCAFCSPMCRDKQIELDKKVDKAPNNPNGLNGIENQWKLNKKKGLITSFKFV